ncbi:hypothetical protein [Oryzihumus leptocrescens]|uniref:Uncharacterized protein n=1 Tax=Oryzihumus leptocrescens TaxID=297536 RepID=A0A542ZMU3_9MICO|nr:hypothetical protein [Oryzihumus leptocrescens]TQL61530.1 hypothetical protein FB474_2941 [Oryzihumus leptocrescens]
MYGDPQRLRALAGLLAREAERIEASASRLERSAAAVAWESTAAGGMQRQAAHQAKAMRQVADRYAEAARAVQQHASATDRQLERIHRAESRARQLLAGLEHALVGGEPAAAAVGRVVLGSPLPPPGHRDWVEVAGRLAGLGVAR